MSCRLLPAPCVCSTGPHSLGRQAAAACPLLISCQPCRSAAPGPAVPAVQGPQHQQCRIPSTSSAGSPAAPVVQGLQWQQCRVYSVSHAESGVAVMWGLRCRQCRAHNASNAGHKVPVTWGLRRQQCRLQSASDAVSRHEFTSARSHGAARGLATMGLIPAMGSGHTRPHTVPWHHLLPPCPEPAAARS